MTSCNYKNCEDEAIYVTLFNGKWCCEHIGSSASDSKDICFIKGCCNTDVIEIHGGVYCQTHVIQYFTIQKCCNEKCNKSRKLIFSEKECKKYCKKHYNEIHNTNICFGFKHDKSGHLSRCGKTTKLI